MKLIRTIVFVPAMWLGMLLSIPVSLFFNMPFIFFDWLSGKFGDWSLVGLIFGAANTVSLSEGLQALVSGVFMSSIGLFVALSVFPFEKHRSKVVYLLLIFLLIEFSSPRQIDLYDSVFLYSMKLAGIVMGSAVIVMMLLNPAVKPMFAWIDRRFFSSAESSRS